MQYFTYQIWGSGGLIDALELSEVIFQVVSPTREGHMFWKRTTCDLWNRL